MKDKPDSSDSSLSETMAARIEINELGDHVHQKKMRDTVDALDGVIESKIEKGAVHVSYDPLATTEKKIEHAIRSTGSTIKAAPLTRKARIQICRHSYGDKFDQRANCNTPRCRGVCAKRLSHGGPVLAAASTVQLQTHSSLTTAEK